MHDSTDLKIARWPFFLGDAFMLALAYFIYVQGKGPFTQWEITAICICVGLGALLGILPFLLEYRGQLKQIETRALGSAVEKLQNLENLATQISSATNHWATAQDQADKTAKQAQEIADRMAGEVRDFTAFMQQLNEGEKSTLRLEVEKLRRAENEWIKVLVHVLDHVYALYHAAQRSGQPQMAGQMTQFQNSCREAARRVGLSPFEAKISEPFDPTRHQWADGEKAPDGARVTELLATGYTFQGRIIRPALVRAQVNGPATRDDLPSLSEPADKNPAAQESLPFEAEKI